VMTSLAWVADSNLPNQTFPFRSRLAPTCMLAELTSDNGTAVAAADVDR
jgi:hypothetical protein